MDAQGGPRPECKGCGEYMSARALYCSHCGMPVAGLVERPRGREASALRFLRMALFALIVSTAVFPPLFRHYQPIIAQEVHQRVEQFRAILAKIAN
jgi:hypothetical protein